MRIQYDYESVSMGVQGYRMAAGGNCDPDLPDGILQPLMENPYAYSYPAGPLIDGECAINKWNDVPVYPLTIIPTRYEGTYEGGRWAAFALNPRDIPDAATDSDPEAQEFWYSGAANVGRGATPSEAVADLLQRLLVIAASAPP